MTRLLLAGVLALVLCGCESVERAADRARDFSAAHPVVTKIALVAGTAAVTTVVVQKLARRQFEEEVRRMEEMQ